jgi:hypothetical protein
MTAPLRVRVGIRRALRRLRDPPGYPKARAWFARGTTTCPPRPPRRTGAFIDVRRRCAIARASTRASRPDATRFRCARPGSGDGVEMRTRVLLVPADLPQCFYARRARPRSWRGASAFPGYPCFSTIKPPVSRGTSSSIAKPTPGGLCASTPHPPRQAPRDAEHASPQEGRQCVDARSITVSVGSGSCGARVERLSSLQFARLTTRAATVAPCGPPAAGSTMFNPLLSRKNV